jgi:hypothetical protein
MIAEALPGGSLLVLADQSYYSGTERAVKKIERDVAAAGFKLLRKFAASDKEVANLPFMCPADVIQSFFDGHHPGKDRETGEWAKGEFPRSKLRFSSSVLKKSI